MQEKLKTMSSPERKKLIARRNKFDAAPSATAEKKVISLKSVKEPTPAAQPQEDNPEDKSEAVRRLDSTDSAGNTGDISLDYTDPLDMFEETR